MLVLEELERAKARGAHIYGEVVGYGTTADAFRITDTHPEGRGAVSCIQMALRDAGLGTGDIDYINAHGTSTPAGDVEEARAIKKLFPNGPKHLQVSSTKSMTGHLLGAAGGVEAIYTIKALETGIIPPTINLENPGEGCDLDYVPNTAREAKVDVVVSNGFGFGGTNGSLVLRTV